MGANLRPFVQRWFLWVGRDLYRVKLARHRVSVFAYLKRQVNIQRTYSNTGPNGHISKSKTNKKIKQNIKNKHTIRAIIMLIRTLQLIKMNTICIGIFSYSNIMSSGISLFGFIKSNHFFKTSFKRISCHFFWGEMSICKRSTTWNFFALIAVKIKTMQANVSLAIRMKTKRGFPWTQ